LNSDKFTSREYLVHAVQSIGKAWTAWKIVESSQQGRTSDTGDPTGLAIFWTIDALLQGVSGFIGALDESVAAKELIEYPHNYKLFEPTIIRHDLMLAGQFLTAFEMLMGSIVNQLRVSFYSDRTSEEEKEIKKKEYVSEVLALDVKSALHASCLWLQGQGVLTEKDILAVDRIRRVRNDIAHRLPALVFSRMWYVPIDQFTVLAELVSKVDIWWLERAGAKESRSGSMLLLEYMLESVAHIDLGEESPLRPKNS